MVWSQYLDDQWDVPDRSDNYAMQIALEVRRVLAKHPDSIKLKDFKMKFERVSPDLLEDSEDEELGDEGLQHPLTEEEKTWVQRAKARWFGFLGVKSDG